MKYLDGVFKIGLGLFMLFWRSIQFVDSTNSVEVQIYSPILILMGIWCVIFGILSLVKVSDEL